MLESQLPDGARDKIAIVEATIAEHEKFLARTRKELEDRIYRAGGEATVEITTLGAVIKTRQLSLDNTRQALARYRTKIAQLPANTTLYDVPPPTAVDGETLDSVRAEISALRAELRTLERAADTAADMLPKIEQAVKAIPDVTPTVTKNGDVSWPQHTPPMSMVLYGAKSRAELINKIAASYTAQLCDGVVFAERATKLMLVNEQLDQLERLEESLVLADPEAKRSIHAPLFAFLSVEAVTKQRRAA